MDLGTKDRPSHLRWEGQGGQPGKGYLSALAARQPARRRKDNIDPGFLNDQYWLLLPFHVSWDTSATVEDAGLQKLPLGKGSAEKIVVKYPSDGGYSPGDTWELYVGSDGRVREMVYRRGGPMKPSVVRATWTGYKKAGPLLVSMDHSGMADDKQLHVAFSDVAVKLAGSDSWVDAK